MVIKRKIGRPCRDPVETYRVQAWFNYVSRMGQHTAYQLEREFSPQSFKKDVDGNTTYPCIWAKYRSGKVTPSAPLMAEVEERYPGSLHWFNHPLWKLLADSTPSPEILKATIAPVKARLTKYVGEYSFSAHPRCLSSEKTYNYFFNFDYKKNFYRYLDQNGLDKLTGALALLIDAEIRKSPIQYKYAYNAVIYNIPMAHQNMVYITDQILTKRISERFPKPEEFTLAMQSH